MDQYTKNERTALDNVFISQHCGASVWVDVTVNTFIEIYIKRTTTQ